ncbi:MAG: SOS response-associated peptidase [Planctomycetes bacterium]|nr:SOS response-associated peptidase [Planctomycetota bacterium]
MPARIVITASASEVVALFDLPDASGLSPQPRYNVAPPQCVPVIRVANGGRELAELRWGLIPHWSGDPPPEGHVNARAETVSRKPSFRDAFRHRRGLVLASGFYGWKPGPGRKQPYYFRPKGGGLFACAAIWDRWTGPDDDLETVSVLTMPANELVMPCDERMPVVLGAEHFAAWLDPKTKDPAKVLAPLAPYPAERMGCWPVSTRVNDPAHDDPGLLVPVSL